MKVNEIKDLAVRITAISTLSDTLEMVVAVLDILSTLDDDWILAERIRETGDPNTGFGSIETTRKNALNHREATEKMLVRLGANRVLGTLNKFRRSTSSNPEISADYLEKCFGYLAIIHATRGEIDSVIDCLETIKETTGNISLSVAQSKLAIQIYSDSSSASPDTLKDLFDYYRGLVFSAVSQVDSTSDVVFWLQEISRVIRNNLGKVDQGYIQESVERLKFLASQKINDPKKLDSVLIDLAKILLNF